MGDQYRGNRANLKKLSREFSAVAAVYDCRPPWTKSAKMKQMLDDLANDIGNEESENQHRGEKDFLA